MRLQINTTQALVGINRTPGQMTIEQPKGEQTIKQTMAKVKIQSEKPRVIIDQYQCFAEAGLKNIFDLTSEYAQLGRQKAMEAVGRINQGGERLAMIGKNIPVAIPELAKQNAWTPQREFNIDTIPKSRPKIDVVGDLKIDWELGRVDISYTPNKPRVDYQKGKLEVYLRQKSSIDIKFIDERI